jgi:uncharacterized SAM-binding protein YcdF (DUF218 family)
LLTLIAVAVAILGLVVTNRPLLVGFAHRFRADDPAPSDVLVVLTGGRSDRALKAAELYQRGVAPVVLIGSDRDTPTNLRDLHSAGVPDEAIRMIGSVASTRDEAVRVRDYLRAHPARRILVVTTAYHSARARWIFRRVLRDTGAEVHLAATEDARFNESNWYRSADGRSIYFRELLKTIYYRLAY